MWLYYEPSYILGFSSQEIAPHEWHSTPSIFIASASNIISSCDILVVLPSQKTTENTGRKKKLRPLFKFLPTQNILRNAWNIQIDVEVMEKGDLILKGWRRKNLTLNSPTLITLSHTTSTLNLSVVECGAHQKDAAHGFRDVAFLKDIMGKFWIHCTLCLTWTQVDWVRTEAQYYFCDFCLQSKWFFLLIFQFLIFNLYHFACNIFFHWKY